MIGDPLGIEHDQTYRMASGDSNRTASAPLPIARLTADATATSNEPQDLALQLEVRHLRSFGEPTQLHRCTDLWRLRPKALRSSGIVWLKMRLKMLRMHRTGTRTAHNSQF